MINVVPHDKRCGYQNSTFPLAVYGCMDTFSLKVIFLFICFSNSESDVIEMNYLKYLNEPKLLPYFLRVDRGTETGEMCNIYASFSDRLPSFDDPRDSIIYGPSTINKTEQLRRDLHHRMEKYFKEQSCALLKRNEYESKTCCGSLCVFTNNPTRM